MCLAPVSSTYYCAVASCTWYSVATYLYTYVVWMSGEPGSGASMYRHRLLLQQYYQVCFYWLMCLLCSYYCVHIIVSIRYRYCCCCTRTLTRISYLRPGTRYVRTAYSKGMRYYVTWSYHASAWQQPRWCNRNSQYHRVRYAVASYAYLYTRSTTLCTSDVDTFVQIFLSTCVSHRPPKKSYFADFLHKSTTGSTSTFVLFSYIFTWHSFILP